tara:strand:+ start:146 stop:391 length:246 start_codon:yes stop_codon:yes gene_type:complete
MLAGLAKLEAFAIAVALTVRINLDSVITNFDRANLPKWPRQPTVDTSTARARLMLSFTAACAAVGPIEAFIIVVVTTTIPY